MPGQPRPKDTHAVRLDLFYDEKKDLMQMAHEAGKPMSGFVRKMIRDKIAAWKKKS